MVDSGDALGVLFDVNTKELLKQINMYLLPRSQPSWERLESYWSTAVHCAALGKLAEGRL